MKRVSVVIAGNYNHGKSTLIGAMVSHFQQAVSTPTPASGGPIPGTLLDSFAEEQSAQSTMDTSQASILVGDTRLVFIDVPGQEALVAHMATGSSYADRGIVVVDAQEGVTKGTAFHVSVLSLLGIRNIAFAITKCDLIGFNRDLLAEIERAARSLIVGATCIPVSSLTGEFLVERSSACTWYTGPTLGAFVLAADQSLDSASYLVLPVQDRYEHLGEERPIYVGRILQGELAQKATLVAVPAGVSVACEIWPPQSSSPGEGAAVTLNQGMNAAFVLEREAGADIARGALLTDAPQYFAITRIATAQLLCFGEQAMADAVELNLNAVPLALLAPREIPAAEVEGASDTPVRSFFLKTAEPFALALDPQARHLRRIVLKYRGEISAVGILDAELPLESPPSRYMQ